VTSDFVAEPGSFRDPASTVFYNGGRVLRGLSERGAIDWDALSATKFFDQLVEDRKVIGTRVAPSDDGVDAGDTHFKTVLEHDRIPVVTYPYEWTFSMLQDAAALHLEILLAAQQEDFTMKDGYAFNVQFQGARPVFIDVGSFEPAREWGPWVGYRQFCQTFLFPLMLQAYKDISFQPFLRGQINGLTPQQMKAFLSGRAAWRKGVVKHVRLHAALDKRMSASETQQTQSDVRKAGFNKEVQVAVARNTLKLVRKLKWKRSDSTWSSYGTTCSYDDENRAAKADFVRRAAGARHRGLSWDLGCNDGTYSRIAAEFSDYVIAADVDDLVIDRLYRTLREEEGTTNILPIVMDLVDPSPGLGWRNRERKPFDQREQPDLVLALALVHHLAIGANVPLPEVVAWFRSLGAEIVVEFVHRDDPLAHHLLQNKPPYTHDHYTLEAFTALIEKSFTVVERQLLPLGTRTMFHLAPKS
jgi:hypothetical protein